MPRAEKDSHFRTIVEAAQAQGWSVERTEKNHWRLRPSDKTKQIVIFSGSPGDIRAIRNFISVMRRNGFVTPRAAA